MPISLGAGSAAERRLRILQVNTFDIGGGAAKVAWDLFTAYRAAGHASSLAVGYKQSCDPDVVLIPKADGGSPWSRFWWDVFSRLERVDGSSSPTLPARLARGLALPGRTLDFYRGCEDFRFPTTARLLSLLPQVPGIIHCHNLHGGYFDLRQLPWLSRQAPLVMTLHDAWLLSGHCAHSFDCHRWQTGCGHCPDLSIYPAIGRDATAVNWQRKRQIYADSQLSIATPSRWLMQKVEQSMLASAVVEARVIPNGVDLSVFKPADRRAARAALGIPQDGAVLLFTANGIRRNMWKDYQTLRDAVARLAERPPQTTLFIALGEDAPPERLGQAEIHFVPYQDDPATVAGYYQAADVYIHAARADTFPNTVIEAQATGTPVVATAVGGIPEQIEDARTGFLVRAGDVQGMVTRLSQLLADDGLRQRMGGQAVEVARQRFDLRRQVDQYLAWYDRLAEAAAHKRALDRNEHAVP